MKKIITIGSFLAVFILIAISYATAVSTNTIDTSSKESPLYGLRTRRAIGEKITNIIDNIKTKFLGERVFWIPLRSFKIGTVTPPPSIGSEGGKGCLTCFFTCDIYGTACGRTCSYGLCQKA